MKNSSNAGQKPHRSLTLELAFALGIVVLILVSRMTIDLPNFKPVMAVALLAGFLFQRQLLGLGATAVGMLAADALIGFYDWRVALVVYAALLTPLAGGLILRRWQDRPLRWATGILGFSGLAAINFYLMTTVAVWACLDWYPATLEGLAMALVMGLPFLKWTLLGNVTFATVLFGGLALGRRLSRLVGNSPLPSPVAKHVR